VMWYSFWAKIRELLNRQDRNWMANEIFHLANRLCMPMERGMAGGKV